MNSTARLHASVNAVAPIVGLAVVQAGEPASVRIDFAPNATEQQMGAAWIVVNAFDWSDAAQAEWEANQHPERKDLRNAASQAITDNDTFLAITSPTNAQVLAQVRRLTQQNTRIIRRLSQID